MSFWEIDYDLLPVRLLPVRLRKEKMIAWLKALNAPVKELYQKFIDFRRVTLYELSHTGQVCYLEDALNDVFDPVSRGIQITDGPVEEPMWLALDDELQPLALALDMEDEPLWFPVDAETWVLGFDFLVLVPGVVIGAPGYDELRLRALVNKYRIAGKPYYSIETV